MNTLDELERLLAATRGDEWRVSNRDPVRVVDGTGAYIALCDPHHKGDPLQETRAALIVAAINALPELLESARRVERLEAEIAELKTSVIAFAAPAAVRYAADWRLPEGHLHSHHYDILEKCGARMTDFTRAALKGA